MVTVRERETVVGKLTLVLGNHLPSLDLITRLNPGHWELLFFPPFFSTDNILLWFLVIQIVPEIIPELDWTCFFCIISHAYTSQADVLADLITGKKGDRLVLKKTNGVQKSEKNIIFCCGRNRMWRNRRTLRAFIDKVWKWPLFSNLLFLLLLKHRFVALP